MTAPLPPTPEPPTAFPQPLHIHLDKDPSPSPHPWGRKAAVAVVALLFLLISSAAAIALPTRNSSQTATLEAPPGTLQVTLDMPAWATLRDPLPINVTVAYTGSVPITRTLSLALEPGTGVALANDGTATIKIVDMPPGGVYSHTFTFLPLASPPERTLYPRILLQDGRTAQVVSSPDWRLSVLPAPAHLRAILDYLLTGSGLLGILTALFWERLKKALALD